MASAPVSISPEELAEIIFLIKETYGYDFTHYSKASLTRRVSRFIDDAKLQTVYDLKFHLTNNKQNFNLFLQTVTVNVTEMFRDPEFYLALRHKVLPRLAAYPSIKIWHAGCATGEEVYSMAILLHEYSLLDRTRIYATDLNPANLEKARQAIIPLHHMKDYTTSYLRSGGKEEFAAYYTARYNSALINKELRRNIIFAPHNLVTDAGFNEFQLILCRNVMIYFEKELQDKVFQLFHHSLSPLGILSFSIKESLTF